MVRSLMTAVGVAAVVALAACDSADKTSKSGATSRPAMGMLNSTCPMSGEAVDPNAKTAAYGGYKIGFCCDNCVGAWEKQSDAEKQAAVAKYTK